MAIHLKESQIGLLSALQNIFNFWKMLWSAKEGILGYNTQARFLRILFFISLPTAPSLSSISASLLFYPCLQPLLTHCLGLFPFLSLSRLDPLCLSEQLSEQSRAAAQRLLSGRWKGGPGYTHSFTLGSASAASFHLIPTTDLGGRNDYRHSINGTTEV